jgi:phosphate transport system substrate-binding protein
LAKRNQADLEVRPVALDAFVLLLNSENPVTQLSINEIRGIYSGRIANWNEIGNGGPDAEIHPFQRNRNSGSQELMQNLVMKELQMMQVPDMMVGTSMAQPFTQLDEDPYGIGYTVYFYQEHMAPAARVKACAVNGVLPAPATIADGSYPLATEVYVVIRDDLPANSSARRLRDWLLSPAGQAIVKQCAYVAVGDTDPAVDADAGFSRHR